MEDLFQMNRFDPEQDNLEIEENHLTNLNLKIEKRKKKRKLEDAKENESISVSKEKETLSEPLKKKRKKNKKKKGDEAKAVEGFTILGKKSCASLVLLD